MKVFTITLNPVYDIFYRVPGFVPYEENQASSVSLYTGGKGVNVTRALLTSGYDTTAYLLLGHENCQPFLDGLTAEQISSIMEMPLEDIKKIIAGNASAH